MTDPSSQHGDASPDSSPALPGCFDDLGLAVSTDEPLACHTWLGIGGPARFFCEPVDVGALTKIIRRCHQLSMPLRVIGGGSNVLIDSAGFDVFDIFRPALWNDSSIRWWFRQNIFLFVRRGSAAVDLGAVRALQGPLVDVIHPENFASKVNAGRATTADLRAQVSELKGRLAAADDHTCYECRRREQRTTRAVAALRRSAEAPQAQRLLATTAGQRAKSAAKKLLSGLQ